MLVECSAKMLALMHVVPSDKNGQSGKDIVCGLRHVTVSRKTKKKFEHMRQNKIPYSSHTALVSIGAIALHQLLHHYYYYYYYYPLSLRTQPKGTLDATLYPQTQPKLSLSTLLIIVLLIHLHNRNASCNTLPTPYFQQ